MSKYGQIKAQARNESGKGIARKLRADGKIPAVIYGQGKGHKSLAIDPVELRRAMDPRRRINTLFDLEIEGEGDEKEQVLCMLTDVQHDHVRDDILHVDFLRVSKDDEVTVVVPVKYLGRPIGVAMGGKLRTFRRVVKVASKPGLIPEIVNIDISKLDGGASLRFGDLTIENARILEAPQTVAALVEMPRQAKVKEDDKKKAKKK